MAAGRWLVFLKDIALPILLIPQPNKDIQFHPFADGGVLHLKGSHRLWAINITSATLWCLLDGRADVDELTLSYGERFGIEAATARGDVAVLLAQFEKWGLLNGGATGVAVRRPTGKPPIPPPARRPTGNPQIPAPPAEAKIHEDISNRKRMAFALASLCFTVTIADNRLAEHWRRLFRHLAIATEPVGRVLKLAIFKEAAEDDRPFYGRQNGIRVKGRLAGNAVFPWLVYKLFDHGMAGLNQRLLFHAAVVAQNGRALLMPAVSGSGKSTLAAALCASGWTYLSDELAVVDPQTLRVEPFALPIGLKDKSMSALRYFIPRIEDLPRHIRADGIGLRYFTPAQAAPEGGLPIQAIVFPCYGQDSPTTLTTLKPLDALSALATTGSSARPLESKDVAAILQLASLPGYRLEFSDLKAALEQLDGLLTK
jgi:hypothetical protein